MLQTSEYETDYLVANAYIPKTARTYKWNSISGFNIIKFLHFHLRQVMKCIFIVFIEEGRYLRMVNKGGYPEVRDFLN